MATINDKKWANLVINGHSATDMKATTAYASIAAGIYASTNPTLLDQTYHSLTLTSDGRLRTDATLVTGDIEIGAVELKDGATDARAVINAANTARTQSTTAVVVQLVNNLGIVNAIQGQTAHDSVDLGNPIKIGGFAADPTALPTAVSTADRVNVCASTQGELLFYNSRLQSGEDQTNNIQAVVQKPLAVSTYAYTVDQSGALEASTVTKATPGIIYKVDGRVDSTAATTAYFIQFLNASSLPADGAVTHLRSPKKIQHTTGTDSTFSFDFSPHGVYASTGIVICLSNAEFVKTIGSAVISATVLYA